MILKTHLLSLVLLIFPLSVFAGGFGEVGNGGDGVTRNGSLILRDLAELGGIQTISVGKETDPVVHALAKSLPQLGSLHVDAELFARKLTDVEKARPGLGIAVIEALRFYTFEPLAQPLAVLGDDTWPSTDPRVQLAVRRYFRIYYHPETFARLDEINKIALLMHEAFYSLGRIHCTPERCRQQAEPARAITSAAFSAKGLLTLRDLSSSLDLPGTGFCRLPIGVLEITSAQRKTDPYKIFLNTDEATDTIRSFCAEFSASSELSARVQTQQLVPSSEIYVDDFGPQLAIQIRLNILNLDKQWTSPSRLQCERSLFRFVREALLLGTSILRERLCTVDLN